MADRITNQLPVDASVSGTDEDQVVALLDYHEFLAVLADRGLVDVPLLPEMRGGAMTRCFHICDDYVQDRRKRVWRNLYSVMEMFAEAYARRAGS